MAKHYWFGVGEKGGVRGLARRPVAQTEKGAPQVTEAAIRKMVDQGFPGADTWRDLQKLTSANSKWYLPWSERAGADGRLRTSIRQNGTTSGRFSVEFVQLQAIPHDFKLKNGPLAGIPSPRDLIDAGVPAGWELWELDLAQAELRVAAYLAGERKMLDMIEQGEDLHGFTAQELFGVKPGDSNWGELRQVAKRGNFSLIFGIGHTKLRGDIEKQTGIDLGEGPTRELVQDWNALYPAYRKAIDYHSRIIEQRMRKNRGYGWITLQNGERRWFLPGEDTHKAFNQRVQPNIAQYGIDLWLWAEDYLERELGAAADEKGGGLVLMVHDSMVLLLPESEGDRITSRVQEYAGELWSKWFPGVPGELDRARWSDHT